MSPGVALAVLVAFPVVGMTTQDCLLSRAVASADASYRTCVRRAAASAGAQEPDAVGAAIAACGAQRRALGASIAACAGDGLAQDVVADIDRQLRGPSPQRSLETAHYPRP